MKPKIGDAVLVEWEDSYGCSSSWQNISDDKNAEPNRMLCQSVGWIIHQSRKAVVIVPHLAENKVMDIKQGCGDMTIPTACILKLRRLNLGK